MTDHIAMIRRYIDVLPDIAYQKSARKALDAIETELQRLRDDPNRLDLMTIPSGWQFDSMSWNDTQLEILLTKSDYQNLPRDEQLMIIGIGKTPRSVLAAAIKRTKP